MNEQETINTELFAFPSPTETELRIRKALIIAGNREIQKPLEIFTAVLEQVAERISCSLDEHGRYRPNYFHTSIFCYSWAAHLSLLGLSGLPPVGKELRELLYARLWFSLDNAVLQSAFIRLNHFIHGKDEYVPVWSLETAKHLFSEMKNAKPEKADVNHWHLTCMDIYEYICLKNNLVFHQFPELYRIETAAQNGAKTYTEEIIPRFTANAIRYPSSVTEPFETILNVVRAYSRPVCDIQPFSAEDPWLEERLLLCGDIALKMSPDETFENIDTQEAVFKTFMDNKHLLQFEDRDSRDTVEEVYRHLCTSYGVQSHTDDINVNPWRNSHLFMAWRMDDDSRVWEMKQGELMSRLVPVIDHVDHRKRSEFRTEMDDYFKTLYPFVDADHVAIDISTAVSKLAEIVNRYLPQKSAVAFCRSVLDVIVHDSSPGEPVLKAIMDRSRVYTHRSTGQSCESAWVSRICQCLRFYFPACRTEKELEKNVCPHIVLQSALFRFTQSMPAAYHILTEQNATDIFDTIRIEAHATPEAKDFVIRHVYAILCEMDGMPRYLTGECHLTEAD